MRKFACSLALSCLVCGCAAAERPAPKAISVEDEIAAANRLTDCEWKAANLYDDGRYTIAELARRIMGVCAVELTQAEMAFHLSLNDPDIKADELNQAVEVV